MRGVLIRSFHGTAFFVNDKRPRSRGDERSPLATNSTRFDSWRSRSRPLLPATGDAGFRWGGVTGQRLCCVHGAGSIWSAASAARSPEALTGLWCGLIASVASVWLGGPRMTPSEVAYDRSEGPRRTGNRDPEAVHETIARPHEVRAMARAIREACRQLRSELRHRQGIFDRPHADAGRPRS
jgi:hypothetical protein